MVTEGKIFPHHTFILGSSRKEDEKYFILDYVNISRYSKCKNNEDFKIYTYYSIVILFEK